MAAQKSKGLSLARHVKKGRVILALTLDRHKELTQSKGRMSTEEHLYKAHKTVFVIGARCVSDSDIDSDR